MYIIINIYNMSYNNSEIINKYTKYTIKNIYI